jgi:hypothetical protein
MADTLIREGIAYGSQPLSPVPQVWDGVSAYTKVQGVNGAIRAILFDSAGETFTDASPGSVTVVSSAGGTAVLNSGNPGIVEIVLSAGGTVALTNANPGNIQILSSAGGTVLFSTTNPGVAVNKVVGSANNTWSANATITAGATSTAVDLQYAYNISYFGTITNTASITLNLLVSQDNSTYYTAATATITAGTSSNFHYSTTSAARYAKLMVSGISSTITATIAGK